MAVGSGVPALWRRWLQKFIPLDNARRHSRRSGRLWSIGRSRIERLENRLVLSTFYVSPLGNDGASGLVPASPLRTIQTAVNRAGSITGTHSINVAGGAYATPGLDQTIIIPANPNLANLQLLGGWNTNFTVRDQIATPTIYIPQNSGTASSPDVLIGAPSVNIDGFSFTFDGTQGTGGTRQSGGILVNASGVVLNSNFIEVGNSSTPGANDAYGIQTQENANVTNLRLSNNTLTASANNVSSGIYLRPGTNNGTILVIGNKVGGDNLMRGIVVDTLSNVTVTSNTLDRNGPANAASGQLIYAGPLTGNVDQSNITIVRNSLDNNNSGGGTGINVDNAVGIELGNGGGTAKITNLHVAENYITDSEIGMLVGRGVDTSTTLIRGNSITANVIGLSRTPDAGQIINASGNWWNSASGPAVASNPGTGDSIFNISVEDVDYSPWLTTGDDNEAVTLGFQADFSQLTANATSPRSPAQGTSGNFQDGVNQTLTTGTLILLTGTYDESVTVNKNITISPEDDPARGTVTLSGSTGNSTLNGGTYLVSLNGAALESDLIRNSANTLTLTGAKLKVSSQATSTVGQVFTIIESPGGISGEFDTLSNGATFVAENGHFYQIAYSSSTVTLTEIADTTPPTATVTTAAPTINVAAANTSTTTITITYADDLAGVDAGTFANTNISVSNGGTPAPVDAFSFAGNSVTYTIRAPSGTWGASPQGTYFVSLVSGTGGVADGAGNTVAAVGIFSTFTVDTTPLTVTIDQSSSQADPTRTSPITFRVVFNKPVTDFTTGDVTLSGTAGATTAIVTAVGGPGNTYDVMVSGMTSDGTVIASINPSVATDASGNPNTASTSTDNSVLYDTTPPTATVTTAAPTINVATAATTSTTVTITYADSGSGLATSTLGSTNITVSNGATTANVSGVLVNGNAVTYTIDAPGGTWGASTQGTYTIGLLTNVQDQAGNAVVANAAFSSFVVDTTPLTVTINRTSGQADPTNSSPINFRVVFNKRVTDFTTGDVALSGTAGATTAIVTAVGGPGNTFDVAVSGMTTDGTVVASINPGVATDAAGNPNTASTSTDNSVLYDTTPPTATVTTAAPTINVASAATTSTTVTVTYADSGSGLEASSLGSTNITVTNGATTANVTGVLVSGSDVTYTIAAPGGTWGASAQGTYTIGLLGNVKDQAGNAVAANATFSSFLVDTTLLSVTIDRSSSQADPTNLSPINFRVVFNKPVTGFTTGDITLGGTAGATTAIVTPVSGPGNTFDVAVNGMTTDGTVIASINPGVGVDAAGNPNTSSTSTDNSVLYDTTAPTATLTTAAPTINVASAATTSTTVTITYSDFGSGLEISSLGNSNITVTNGATTATVTGVLVSGNDVTYTISAPGGTWGASTQGTYTIGLLSNVKDQAGNVVATNGTFSSFAVDTTPLTVTIDRTSGQADPTNGSPINFRVVFNKPVTDFTTGDVTLSGTAGATTAIVTAVGGPGNTYDVAVSGMTSDGTVVASINPSVATDAAGNPNTASTSTDNSVLFDQTPPTATVTTAAPTINVASAATTSTTVTITYADSGSGLAASTLGSTNITVSNGTTTANISGVLVSGNAVTYTIDAPGGTWGASTQGTYTIGLLTNVQDQAGNAVVANAAFSSFVVDTTPLTVTIDQSSGQADPTRTSPITFRVVFNKPVTDFTTGDVTLSGTAGATTAIVTSVGGPGTTYDVAVSGMTGDGTVIASINPGVAADAAGNPNTASISTDNSVLYDTTLPTATVTTAAPTINVAAAATTSTTVTITYADSGSGLAASTLGSTNITVSNGATTANVSGVLVSGNAVTYTIDAPGGTWSASTQGTYTIGLLGNVQDQAGNAVAANAAFSSFLVDTTLLTVTIDRGSSQADPTNTSPMNFRVVFNKPVTGFTTGDITLGGAAGATTAIVTPVGGPGNTFDVAVSGMTGDGIVIASINPGVAVDAAGNPNTASTSTDNSVLYDTTAPTATLTTAAPTINVASAATISTTVTITYADSGSGLEISSLGNPNIAVTNGTTTAVVTGVLVSGNDVTYTIAAPGGTWGASTQGTYTIGLLSNVQDQAGNAVAANAAFSSFLVDTTPLTVTIDQDSGQNDPTNASPINFQVVFNKPVTGFAADDVILTGTAGATTVIVTAVGSTNDTWNVAVNGMSANGTVIASINPGAATDAPGNPNTASTSGDNSVLYDTLGPTATVTTPAPTINVATAGTTSTTITISYDDPGSATGTGSGINLDTISIFNIVVTNGATQAIVNSFSNGGNTVTYTINAPGGTWGASAQGTYTIALANSVRDMAGNAVAANAAFSSFVVDTTPLTVTIDKNSSQLDPTNSSPINFRVVFNKPVTDFTTGDVTLSGTAGATTAIITAVGGPGTTYDVVVSGMTTDGTVVASINPGVATDAAGNPNTPSTSTDNSVLYDTTPPTATVTTAAPTINVATAATTSTTVTVTYADSGSGLAASTLGSTNITVSNGTTTANVSGVLVSGNAVTYTIDAPGGTWGASVQGTYTIGLLNNVQDQAGNALIDNLGFSSFVVDTTPLTVTINQAVIQADPTNGSPITFRVVFNKPVSGFTTGDVTLAGTAGATTAIVTPAESAGTTWNVAVSGMSTDGTVIATINPGVATDAAGNPNTASTSSDNTVLFDQTPPVAALTTASPNILAAQAGTNSTTITITYSDSVAGLDPSSFSQSNITVANGAAVAVVTAATATGNSVTYTISAPAGTWGVSAQGTYTVALVGDVKDLAGNFVVPNASISSFIVDTTPLTVTIDQAPGQPDPTNASPINFRVVFNKPVIGFTTGDVTLSGTASATTAVVSTSDPTGGIWDVAVSGMSTDGTVIATIMEGVARDAAGNPNTVSTSSDNTVLFDTTSPTARVTTPAPTINVATAGTSSTTITISYSDPGSDIGNGGGMDTSTFATTNITVTNGATTANVIGVSAVGNIVTYTIAAPGGTWGASPQGTYTIALVSDVQDVVGNAIAADASFSSFVVDTIPLTVTINQDSGQADPTNTSPINFRVVFNKPVFGFATGDVTLGGTAGATTATVTPVALGGVTWNVAVSGMTTDGTVTATIAAGVASDLNGNPNTASTSADNSILFDTTSPTATLTTPAPTITAAAAGTTSTTVTITYGDVSSGVDPTSFAGSNINVTNGATVTGISVAGNAVTYTIAAPAGSWGASPQGIYTIGLNSGAAGVTDRVGNAAIGNAAFTSFLVDTPTVTLSVAPATLAEENGTATVTATLSAPSTLDVTVDLDFKGTATNLSDYTRAATQILIPAGSTTGTVTLTAAQDTLQDPAETIVVDILSVNNAIEAVPQQITATIIDDDAPIVLPSLSVSDVSTYEGRGGTVNVTFVATLSPPSTQPVTVNVATEDGTAHAPADYTALASQTLTFAPGETTKSVTITVIGDTLDDEDLDFTINLSDAGNATIADAQGVATIVDDDAQMFRVYNPYADLHVFTISRLEFETLVGMGYRDETTDVSTFRVSTIALPGALPIRRLYNPNAGHHYLTTSDGDRDFLLSQGWRLEPDQGFLFPSFSTDATPIYHLYNKNNGDHFYTANDYERVYILSHPVFPTPWTQHNTLGFSFTHSLATTPRQAVAADSPAGEVPPILIGTTLPDDPELIPTASAVAAEATVSSANSSVIAQRPADDQSPVPNAILDDTTNSQDHATLDTVWQEFDSLLADL